MDPLNKMYRTIYSDIHKTLEYASTKDYFDKHTTNRYELVELWLAFSNFWRPGLC
jgi:hypothetical protein